MSNLETQMVRRDKEMVPRILVRAMFAVMVGSLAIVTFATMTDRPHVGVPAAAPAIAEAPLRFRQIGDRPGKYSVHDADGALLVRSDEARMGFIGVIGRSLDRKRQVAAADADAPIRLIRRESGTLAIVDDLTGWTVELVGYGTDNLAAFAALIDD